MTKQVVPICFYKSRGVLSPKILVVDDEKNIRLYMEHLLQRDGYEVKTAENGEIALSFIAIEEFDIVLLDLMMPGINGLEVLANLHECCPETVVILLTAYASLETAVEALRHGTHDYLFKPSQAKDLRESIHKGIQKRQQVLQQRTLFAQLEQNLIHSLNKLRATTNIEYARTTPVEANQSQKEQPLRQGRISIDLARHIVAIDEKAIELSPLESEIVTYLVKEFPRVVTSQEIIQKVLGYKSEQWEANDVIRAHIYRIRQKINNATNNLNVIRTVRGVGYTIATMIEEDK